MLSRVSVGLGEVREKGLFRCKDGARGKGGVRDKNWVIG